MKAVFFLYFLEIFAFFASIYFYKKNKNKPNRFLVFFLGFTVFVELVGFYPGLIDKYNVLDFLRNTGFEKNLWLYNIYLIVSMVFYVTYFKWCLKSNFSKRILKILAILFVIGCILFLIFSGTFYIAFSSFTVIVGTLLIFLSIAFYYLELLNSDQILSVFRSMPFYVSIGALIFHLCTTPLFIYSNFFIEQANPEFVALYIRVIFSSNFILYTLYIVGFLICARPTKQL